MIDLKSVIQTGVIPSDEWIRQSLGEHYFLFAAALSRIDRSNQADYLAALKAMGEVYENQQEYYPAALCYAIASTFNDAQSYQLLMLLIDKNNLGPAEYNLEIDTIPRSFCEDRIAELQNPVKPSITDIKTEFLDLKNLLNQLNANMILAKKLDLMYEILKLSEQHLTKIYKDRKIRETLMQVRDLAQQFIQIVLDMNNEDSIEILMRERHAKRKLDPEFIPGLKPKISELPDPLLVEGIDASTSMKWRKLSELLDAKQNKKIMVVSHEAREADLYGRASMLTPLERDAYRVLIRRGKFYQIVDHTEFKLFDTKRYTSHEKENFGSYTINIHGEISVFNHYGMREKNPFSHSTMNSGRAVYAAGEIQISEGILIKMTVYSGHYKPDPDHIYLALNYFTERGIDLSQVRVYFFNTVDHKLGLLPVIDHDMLELNYTYNAYALHSAYNQMERLLEEDKQKRKGKMIPPAAKVLVGARKSELLKRIHQIVNEFPQLSVQLNPVSQKIADIDAEISGSAKILAVYSAILLPILKNNLYDYIWFLLDNSGKYHFAEIQKQHQALQHLLHVAIDVETNYQSYTHSMETMKTLYHKAMIYNKSLNQNLKNDTSALITDLLTELKSCVKKPKGFLSFFHHEAQQSLLKCHIDNLEILLKNVNKVDTSQASAFLRLDTQFNDLNKIFCNIKKTWDQDLIAPEVNSIENFKTILTSWTKKMEPLESSLHENNDGQTATSEPSQMPKTL